MKNHSQIPLVLCSTLQVTQFFSGPLWTHVKGRSAQGFSMTLLSLVCLSFKEISWGIWHQGAETQKGERNSEKPVIWLGWFISCNVTKYCWAGLLSHKVLSCQIILTTMASFLQVLVMFALNTLNFRPFEWKLKFLLSYVSPWKWFCPLIPTPRESGNVWKHYFIVSTRGEILSSLEP